MIETNIKLVISVRLDSLISRERKWKLFNIENIHPHAQDFVNLRFEMDKFCDKFACRMCTKIGEE